jgi:alpha-tubulin suppressor-like RCC1 family protein
VVVAVCLAACATEFETDGGSDDGAPDTTPDTVLDTPVEVPAEVPEDPVVDGGAECGNGEPEGDEECDDGNDVNGDGCENDCTWTCHSADECDDAEMCNGEEMCTEDHVCAEGSWLDDGTLVDVGPPRMICLDGETRQSVCGDGFVDTGAGEFCDPPGSGGCEEGCVYGCTDDGDCPDDGNVCNGTEYCNTGTHVCDRRDVPSSGTDCDDGNPCTATDTCDGAGTCVGTGNPCVDGHDCTDDICDGSTGGCSNPIHGGWCLISGTCYSDGTVSSGDDCEECRSSSSQTAWVDRSDGSTCADEGISCTDDVCQSGSCEHPVSTGFCLISGTACHTDGTINPLNECQHCDSSTYDISWSARSRGTPCSTDGVSCTIDQCIGGVCDHDEVDTGYCLISGTCYSTGFTNPSNFCEECSTSDPTDWSPRTGTACDDGDFCTTSDACTTSGTCVGTAEPYIFDAVQISGGWNHTCARLGTGRIRCWGYGSYGKLGIGSTINRYRPVEVSGITAATDFDAGHDHNCAIEGGVVKCWGRNSYGQVGDGGTTHQYTPVTVTGLGGTPSKVSAGMEHSCALLTTGQVRCWGRGDGGELGNGAATTSHVPVTVQNHHGTGPLTGVTDIAAGNDVTCAIVSGGYGYCWGQATYGKLGNGISGGTYALPQQVCEEAGCTGTYVRGLEKLAANNFHVCARKAGNVLCWGYNVGGQLGNGTIGTNATYPQQVLNDDDTLLSGVTGLSVGGHHSCARLSSGHLKCWGNADDCQVGDGGYIDRSKAVYVRNSSGAYLTGSSLTGLGYNHSCAINGSDDNVLCWGSNMTGALGDGTTTTRCWPTLTSCSY